MARSKFTLRSAAASALALGSAIVPLAAVQAPANAVEADITADNSGFLSPLREQMLKTPLKQLTATTEINLPSTFDANWKVRANGGDSLKQYTANKITSQATGLVGYETATLETNKSVGFAQGTADNSNVWAEIGTSGNVMMVAGGDVQIPLRVSVGSYFKNFTVTAPYSANGTVTVDLPVDVIASAADEGLNLSGATVTLKTSTAELSADAKRVPAVCWTPTTAVANKIDIKNSQGIARVGNTFVIPGGVVSEESAGYKRVKLASDIAVNGTTFQGRLSGLELELKDGGFGSVQANLYSFVGETDASGKTNYRGLQQAPLFTSEANFSDDTWDFDNQELKSATITGQVMNSFGSPLLNEAEDYQLGDLDLGCETHQDEFVTGYNYLTENSTITLSNDGFTDVSTEDMFSAEIDWVARKGILRGYTDGSFKPTESINRDAVAASLYRMAGSPAYTAPKVSPFKDVPTTHPFYTEISWMYEMGLSTGYTDGTFRPGTSINRDAMAAFLYRFAGSPEYTAPAASPFKDLKPSTQFYKEISWLSENKISTGWSDGTFRPYDQVRRDAMAAFLYRYDQNVTSHI